MTYKQVEVYGFEPIKEWEQIKAFADAYPDWKREDSTALITFTKEHIVTMQVKEANK